jgi:hypothetical protein
MPEYYENSFVTICAASANNCTQGFLRPRSQVPYAAGPFMLRYDCPNDTLKSVQLVQYSNFITQEEFINSRGLTLQDSLLSTRLLTYGTRNLRWSCREAEFSDGGPWEARYDLSLRHEWGNPKLKINTGISNRAVKTLRWVGEALLKTTPEGLSVSRTTSFLHFPGSQGDTRKPFRGGRAALL